MNNNELLDNDSPFVNALGEIRDKSFPRMNEGWIKKDDVRFDEPKPTQKQEEIPYGAMDLGVDPNTTPKVEPGESLVDKESNTELPEEETDHFKVKTKTVLRFGDPNARHKEYVDPRLPKSVKRIRKLKIRPKEDL